MEHSYQSSTIEFKSNKEEISSNVYHNTKLLLTLYGNVAWRIKNDIQMVKEECEYEVQKNLNNFIDNLVDVELFISNIKISKKLYTY